MVDFISRTGISNMALSHVGADPIENFDADSKIEGKQCRLWYDYSRRMVLEAHDWNFARIRLTAALHANTISETSTAPLAGIWSYRYQYPGDCLIMRKVQNPQAPPSDSTPFDIELSLDGSQRTVVTNMEDAVFVYTFDQEAISTFSSIFVLSLSHLLAHHVAFSLARKNSIKKDHLLLYQNSLPAATAISANEAVGAPPREAEWVRGRA